MRPRPPAARGAGAPRVSGRRRAATGCAPVALACLGASPGCGGGGRRTRSCSTTASTPSSPSALVARVHAADRDPRQRAHQRRDRARRPDPPGGQRLPGRRLPDRELPELMNLEDHGLLAKLPSSIARPGPGPRRLPAGDWVGVALRVSASPTTRRCFRRRSCRARSSTSRSRSGRARSRSPRPTRTSRRSWARSSRSTARPRPSGGSPGSSATRQIYQDEEAVVAAVNRGDVAAGLINQYYWYRLRLELGAKARSTAGSTTSRTTTSGSIENISGAAVLASSKHQAAGRAVRPVPGQPSRAADPRPAATTSSTRPGPGSPPNPRFRRCRALRRRGWAWSRSATIRRGRAVSRGSGQAPRT